MKTILKTAVAGVLLAATISSASAALVGSITRNYGSSASSAPSLGAGTCDTLNTSSITVRDSSGCQRFYDAFNFSSFSYGTLDHLTLSLTFGSNDNVNTVTIPFVGSFPSAEDWQVRFASSATVGSTTLHDMNNYVAPASQSFDLTNSESVFSTIAANKVMYLWFSEQGAGANNFELLSARLDVFDTTAVVPEPTSIALFGVALGLLGVSRRKMR